MKKCAEQRSAEDYLALRAEARREGHRLGKPAGELAALLYDYGTTPTARAVRAQRRAARSLVDPLAIPFERRAYGTWATRTYDLVLTALAECRQADRRIEVRIAEGYGAEEWQLSVSPSWIASVHAKGLAVVEGALTLSATRYPHALPSGAQAFYASWAVSGRKGYRVVSGALYRPGKNEPWRHARAELTALDRILDEERPHVVPPAPKPRSFPVKSHLVRVGLADDEFRFIRAAAGRAEMNVSQWAREVLLRATGNGKVARRKLGVIYFHTADELQVEGQSSGRAQLALSGSNREQAVRFLWEAARSLSGPIAEGWRTVSQVGDRIVIGRPVIDMSNAPNGNPSRAFWRRRR